MKKILLSIILIALIGSANQSKAQCSGAVIITNFIVLAPGNTVFYSFDWQYVQGNASIQVTDSCNGVFQHAEACIPRLKDSTAGPHHVTGSFPTTCSGALTVAILIWTNPACGGTSCTAERVTITHSPLPVSFKSFSATRNHSNVLVKWETASEQNNSGFAIERSDNGGWQQIAWVASQSIGGNSDAVLSYSYNDLNNVKGISQYRIRQVDLDQKSRFSDIRTVRGEGQMGKIIVYPNPSNNGRVNVSFEDASASRNVSVMDMSGRSIKEYKGVTNNNITIENLKPGMYTIKVSVPETGEQAVQKVVVN